MGPKAGRPVPPMTEADERRFWSKVALPNENECLEWMGAKSSGGYGLFFLGGAKHRAHRVAWTLAEGPIPPGLVLDHLCRNRACVNPRHLEVVTNRENTVRGELWQRAVTSCPAGHAYDEANTYRRPPSKSHPNGGRMCRTCMRERDRARYWRKRRAAGAADS